MQRREHVIVFDGYAGRERALRERGAFTGSAEARRSDVVRHGKYPTAPA